MCIGERIHTVWFEEKVFGQVQGDAAAATAAAGSLSFSLLAALLSDLSPSCIVSFLRLSFTRRSSLLSSLAPRSPVGAARFVSFRFSSLWISPRCARGDLGAYTRTRQLLRTTRHIVSSSPLLLTLFLYCSLSLFRSFAFRNRDILRDVIRMCGGGFRATTKYVYRKARFRECVGIVMRTSHREECVENVGLESQLQFWR